MPSGNETWLAGSFPDDVPMSQCPLLIIIILIEGFTSQACLMTPDGIYRFIPAF